MENIKIDFLAKREQLEAKGHNSVVTIFVPKVDFYMENIKIYFLAKREQLYFSGVTVLKTLFYR